MIQYVGFRTRIIHAPFFTPRKTFFATFSSANGFANGTRAPTGLGAILFFFFLSASPSFSSSPSLFTAAASRISTSCTTIAPFWTASATFSARTARSFFFSFLSLDLCTPSESLRFFSFSARFCNFRSSLLSEPSFSLAIVCGFS